MAWARTLQEVLLHVREEFALHVRALQHGTHEEFACAEHLIGSIIYAFFLVFFMCVCFFLVRARTLQVVQHGTVCTCEEFACADHLIGSIIYALYVFCLFVFLHRCLRYR